MKLFQGLACSVGLAFGLPAAAQAAAPAVSCASLARLALPNATITQAQTVRAGAFAVPQKGPGPGFNPAMDPVGRLQPAVNPAFCRVAATVKPSADSDIKIEVWLPSKGWNGKLFAAGNFGWGGSLMYAQMLSALADGYAAASTDTGHDSSGPDGGGGKFTLGHPEKVIDYAYRADHEMTLKAKALIKAFYGRGPSRSYWIGCSLGGLEALVEAKRYPGDYDGIVAGAPPNPLFDFNAVQLWPSWLVGQDPSRLIPKEKYAMIHAAALAACDTPVGRKDGLIERPDRCRFDPVQLQCKTGDAPDCLTEAQVFLVRQMYQGARDPQTGAVIFPGPARGSELEWSMFASDQPMSVALDLFRYTAFQDPNWTSKTMDWHKDVAAAGEKLRPLFSVDTNLEPFFARGGKLMLYIGWNDYHNPEQLVDYYKAVVRDSTDTATRGSVQLFTIPGMNHCAGGAGCDVFNKLGAIDAWVARGQVPQRLVTLKLSGGQVVRSRPACAYPKVATYVGAGDTEDAASFVCADPQ